VSAGVVSTAPVVESVMAIPSCLSSCEIGNQLLEELGPAGQAHLVLAVKQCEARDE